MALVTTKRGSSVIGTSGTTWANTANAVDGAVGTIPATYATMTNATSGATGYIEIGGFDFSGLSSGQTVTQAQIVVRHLVNTAGRYSAITAVLYDGATIIGTAQTITQSTSATTTTLTSSVAPTMAQVKSANFKVRINLTHASNTQSAVFSLDHVEVVVTDSSPSPKLETLTDTFDSSVDKATKWSNSAAAVVWDASGRAKIPVTTSYWSLGTSNAGQYDMTGSFFLAQMTLPAVGAGSRETFMEVFRGGVTNDKYSMYVSGTNLTARRTVGGTTSGQQDAGAYNPTTMAWWRIRESGGTIYYGYSADGSSGSWTEFYSVAAGFAVTNVYVGINSGYWGTETASDTFVDNVNTPPGAGGALTANVADTMGVTDSETGDYGEAASDPVGITDSVATSKSAPGDFSDLARITDSVATAAVAVREVSDQVGVTDSVSTAGGLPKASTLQDAFTTQVDLARWDVYGTVAWDAGRAAITERAGGYSGMATVAFYDLTSSSVFLKLDVPPGAPSRGSAFAIYQNTSNGVWAFVEEVTRELFLRMKTVGANDDVRIPYDPVAHAWLRIRMAGSGTVLWDVSPDGLAWSNLRTSATTLDLTAVTVEVSCGQWAVEGGGLQTAYVDNVNIAPAALTANVADTVGVTDGTTRTLDRDTSDIAGVTDTLGTLTSRTLAVDLSDPIGVTDTAGTVGVLVRSYTEPAGVTDSVGTSRSSPGDFADLVGIADYLGMVANYVRGYTEPVGLTDSVLASKALVKDLSDAVGLTDSIARLMARGYVDPVGLTDTATRLFTKGLTSDSVGLTDTVSATTVGAGGRPKVWMGSAWMLKPVKVWNGSGWVVKPMKVWTGTTWKVLA